MRLTLQVTIDRMTTKGIPVCTKQVDRSSSLSPTQFLNVKNDSIITSEKKNR